MRRIGGRIKTKAAGFCAAVMLIIAAVFLTAFAMDSARADKAVYDDISIGNYDEVVAAIRQTYKHRSSDVLLTFTATTDSRDELREIADELVTEALSETDSPEEGDYLSYQNGGYTLTYSAERTESGYVYRLRIKPDFYTYRADEEYVTEQVNELIETLGLSDEISDYEKAQRIYGWMYENITYDTVHKEKDNNKLKHTAYSALRYHTAGCQGYSVLFYRLAKEAGLPVRVVTGSLFTGDREERHAWNIVEIDGEWYGVDVTTDRARDERLYFLCGENGLQDHVMDAGFCEEYQLSKKGYGE